jgi:hypothetical protein
VRERVGAGVLTRRGTFRLRPKRARAAAHAPAVREAVLELRRPRVHAQQRRAGRGRERGRVVRELRRGAQRRRRQSRRAPKSAAAAAAAAAAARASR